MMRASLEDPGLPDVIHQRIIRADEFTMANSEAGFNEQQVCWSIIVFIFAYWDEKIRPQIANIRGVEKKEVEVNVFGDLRILRMSTVHHGGVLAAADHAKLKVFREICRAVETISLTHERMRAVFVAIKGAIGSLILEYTANLPGAPMPESIVDVAVQRPSR